MILTLEHYQGQNNALMVELNRCRQIMDNAAYITERYDIKPNQALLARVTEDWADVLKRIVKLDEAYWGKV
jgi:hypothetical protein